MIIEQLNRIIFQIRLAEEQFKLPPYCNDSELTGTALCHKARLQEQLATELYNIVRDYALKQNNI